MKRRGWRYLSVVFLLVLLGCQRRPSGGTPEQLAVVATTNIVSDLVQQVGGPYVHVESLMGPGVDPHLYRASEGDVARMRRAEVIFYNGLHLEGKMAEVLERMNTLGKPTYAVASCIPDSLLLTAQGFGGVYDPHVWMDPSLWQYALSCVAEALRAQDSLHADVFMARAQAYADSLQALDAFIRRQIAKLPPERRILVTSHDAFRYFGQAYGVEVKGLLGISTASEAGTADVKELVQFLIEHRIPAVFLESSVPARYIQALEEAVRARGYRLTVAGPLYSDALGDPGTPEGTYTGMMRYNVTTIVEALHDE